MSPDQQLDLVAYSRRLGGAVTVIAAMLVTLAATQLGREVVVLATARAEQQRIVLLRELLPLPADRLSRSASPERLRDVLREWARRAGWAGVMHVGRAGGALVWAEGSGNVPERYRTGLDWFAGPRLVEGGPGAPQLLAFRGDLSPDSPRPEYLVVLRPSAAVDRRLRTLYLVMFCVITATLGMLYSALISVVARGDVLRREAVAHAEAAHARLVQAAKLSALGELSAGVAHEINNPVAVVRNALEILSDHPDAQQPAVKQGLADVGEAADRIHRIVKDLSAFSAPQATELVPVPLAPLLTRTIELARLSSATGSHVAVELDVPADLPPVRGSEAPLLQVFLNLIGNARFAVTHPPVAAPHVRVTARLVGAMMEVEVADNGAGIAPENLPRIFEPFFTTKPRAEGTGLGLWVSHRIVQSHAGRIRVTSRPGQGTSLVVELPVERAHA